MIDKTILEKSRLAGKVNSGAATLARTLVKPGARMSDIARAIEEYIVERGVGLAFPVNLSLDDVAAHFSPGIIPQDDFTLPEEGLLKVDIGTHVDGYIADHAITIDVGGSGGKHARLIEAAEAALEEAIKHFHAGQNVLVIGKLVEDTIVKAGFQPIRNLGGHNLEQYNLHGGVFVPNAPSGTPYKLKAGDIFAIEPFSTDGPGYVVDGPKRYIYRFVKRPKRKLSLREQSYVEMIRTRFNTLPFSPRWLDGKIQMGKPAIMSFLGSLASAGVLQAYPILMEHGKGLVAQAEHTIIVHEDRAEITTVP